MIESGKIVIGIDKKVYFEYYELEKPDLDNFKKHPIWAYAEYYEAVKKYEASKQLIEVSNKIEQIFEYGANIWMKFKLGSALVKAINNQKCKAEVNGTAKIIELL